MSTLCTCTMYISSNVYFIHFSIICFFFFLFFQRRNTPKKACNGFCTKFGNEFLIIQQQQQKSVNGIIKSKCDLFTYSPDFYNNNKTNKLQNNSKKSLFFTPISLFKWSRLPPKRNYVQYNPYSVCDKDKIQLLSLATLVSSQAVY